MNPARLALTLLTVLPVRGPRTVDRRAAGRAMALAPLVGVLLGFLAGLVVIGARELVHLQRDSLVPPVAGIATLALLTRGLHLDGLADLADGLGASRDRERSLEVMRRSDIGAFGTAALLFAVLGQVAALATAIEQHRGTVTLIVAVTAGRLAVPFACRPGIPAAQPDGLGALVAGTVRPVAAWCAGGLVLAGAAGAGLMDVDGGSVAEAVSAVVAVAAAAAASQLLLGRAVRRLGGITGDVLGALVEIATLVALLVMVLHIPWPLQHALGHS